MSTGRRRGDVREDPEETAGRVVRIGPYDVRIIVDDVKLADERAFGLSDFHANTICIRSTLDPAVWRETLLHEILHHAWHLTALPELAEDHEEVVVRSLSPFLLPFLEDMLEQLRTG